MQLKHVNKGYTTWCVNQLDLISHAFILLEMSQAKAKTAYLPCSSTWCNQKCLELVFLLPMLPSSISSFEMNAYYVLHCFVLLRLFFFQFFWNMSVLILYWCGKLHFMSISSFQSYVFFWNIFFVFSKRNVKM